VARHAPTLPWQVSSLTAIATGDVALPPTLVDQLCPSRAHWPSNRRWSGQKGRESALFFQSSNISQSVRVLCWLLCSQERHTHSGEEDVRYRNVESAYCYRGDARTALRIRVSLL